MNKISIIISTLFGVGFFPRAPGTAGTLFALLAYYFLAVILQINWIILYSSILLISIISVFLINIAENELGHDSPKIVIDELIGYFIAVLFLPKNLFVLIIAFIIFRFFDIIKPEPVNISQKLPGGWGVIIDDVIAGIYTNMFMQLFVVLIKYKKFL